VVFSVEVTIKLLLPEGILTMPDDDVSEIPLLLTVKEESQPCPKPTPTPSVYLLVGGVMAVSERLTDAG